MIVTPAAKLAPKLAEKIDAAIDPADQVLNPSVQIIPVASPSVSTTGSVASDQEPRFEGVRPASDRIFGLVMSFFFALLAASPLRHGLPVRNWAIAVAAIFLTASLIHPPLLAPLNRAWTTLGAAMHAVMTPVVLAVMFFVVLTPIAFVMRRFRRDALGLRFDPGAKSYWKTREPGPAPESMSQQF